MKNEYNLIAFLVSNSHKRLTQIRSIKQTPTCNRHPPPTPYTHLQPPPTVSTITIHNRFHMQSFALFYRSKALYEFVISKSNSRIILG
ncbi:hypothetical protein HanIR_Chr03g0139161 [Helianthus annuus]|nr:hypothetical protein HanIR_Chr03g0139161 [Helianthus annuus]